MYIVYIRQTAADFCFSKKRCIQIFICFFGNCGDIFCSVTILLYIISHFSIIVNFYTTFILTKNNFPTKSVIPKNRAADLSRLPCIKYLKLSVYAVISLKCKPLSCFRSIQPRSQVLPTGILRGYKFCHFQYRLPNQGCISSRLHMRHRN